MKPRSYLAARWNLAGARLRQRDPALFRRVLSQLLSGVEPDSGKLAVRRRRTRGAEVRP